MATDLLLQLPYYGMITFNEQNLPSLSSHWSRVDLLSQSVHAQPTGNGLVLVASNSQRLSLLWIIYDVVGFCEEFVHSLRGKDRICEWSYCGTSEYSQFLRAESWCGTFSVRCWYVPLRHELVCLKCSTTPFFSRSVQTKSKQKETCIFGIMSSTWASSMSLLTQQFCLSERYLILVHRHIAAFVVFLLL